MSIGDTFGYAVGVLGLSPFSFYEMTPKELYSVIEQHQKAEQDKMDMFGFTVYNAIGTSLTGKKYKPLFSEGGKAKVNEGSAKEREETLNYFKDRFNKKLGGDTIG